MRRTSSSTSCPPRLGSDQGHHPVVGQADFLPGVEVVVVGRGLDPGLRAGRRRGPAGCRRRSASGRRRCAGAAGRCRRTPRANGRSCTGRGRAACGPARPAARPPPSSTASCSRRLTIIMRAYISSASGYFTLKFRQKPPPTNRRSAGQRGSSLHLVRDPLVLDQLLGGQRPFGHLAVAAIGQIDLAHRRHVVDRLRRAWSPGSSPGWPPGRRRTAPASRPRRRASSSPARCRTSRRRRRRARPRRGAARRARAR